MHLDFRNAAPKLAFTDLLPLAGLRELNALQLYKVPIADTALEIVPSLPNLSYFHSEGTAFTDAAFEHLAGAPLIKLEIYGSRQITGEKIGVLARSKALTQLSLQSCGLTSAGIREIAALPMLTRLYLPATPLSDADLPPLSALSKLTEFTARRTGISVSALASMQAWRELRTLEVDIKPGEMAAGCELLAQAFPKIEAFNFQGADDWQYSADDVRGLKAFSKLRSLTVFNKTLRDEAVAGLLDLDKLDMLRFDGCTSLTDAAVEMLSRHKLLNKLVFGSLELTDASLTHLAKLRTLKKLEITSCPNLTDAAIAAFQKACPDVTVTR